MRNGILLAVALTLVACGAQTAAGQPPVYKMIWAPPSDGSLGYLGPILEGQTGLFYVLSTWSYAAAPSIFSLSTAGAYCSIHAFPANTSLDTMGEAANGLIYALGTIPAPPYTSIFYSMELSGDNLQQYPFPGQWGWGGQVIVAPGEMYEIVGYLSQGLTVFGFARIDESGKIAILHQFSAADGFPIPYSQAIYGPDGNVYGIGTEQQYGISPGFIFRLTPARHLLEASDLSRVSSRRGRHPPDSRKRREPIWFVQRRGGQQDRRHLSGHPLRTVPEDGGLSRHRHE